jgi:aspartyl-tRNA(Asn)/glutamyl-tRNA(Gln) amidotransferase subunit C
MSLTPEQVRQVGSLARLSLDDAEAERMAHHLNDLLAQFERLKALDTRGVAPTSHAVPVTAQLREDAIDASLRREEVLALTVHVDDQLGGFIVPQVLSGDGGGEA